MAARERDVIVVNRGDSSVKWLFWGAVIGAGVALLYAPSSGEETRRSVQKRLRKLRAATEEKLDEVVSTLKSGVRSGLQDAEAFVDDVMDDEDEDVDGADGDAPPMSARRELEQRLETARLRRRAAGEPRA